MKNTKQFLENETRNAAEILGNRNRLTLSIELDDNGQPFVDLMQDGYNFIGATLYGNDIVRFLRALQDDLSEVL